MAIDDAKRPNVRSSLERSTWCHALTRPSPAFPIMFDILVVSIAVGHYVVLVYTNIPTFSSVYLFTHICLKKNISLNLIFTNTHHTQNCSLSFFFSRIGLSRRQCTTPQITETGKNFPSNVIFCFSRVCFRKARIFCWGKKKISHRAKTRLFGKIGGFFFFFLPSRALETEKNTLYGPTYVYLHGYGYICIAVYLYLYNYIYIL